MTTIGMNAQPKPMIPIRADKGSLLLREPYAAKQNDSATSPLTTARFREKAPQRSSCRNASRDKPAAQVRRRMRLMIKSAAHPRAAIHVRGGTAPRGTGRALSIGAIGATAASDESITSDKISGPYAGVSTLSRRSSARRGLTLRVHASGG